MTTRPITSYEEQRHTLTLEEQFEYEALRNAVVNAWTDEEFDAYMRTRVFVLTPRQRTEAKKFRFQFRYYATKVADNVGTDVVTLLEELPQLVRGKHDHDLVYAERLAKL